MTVEADTSVRILVLDDQPATQIVLAHAARAAGGEPQCAGTLGEARELMAKHRFACAVLDKNLPDGSGLTILRELRETSPETDVVIVTGYANLDSAVEALRLGARDYVVKPFDLNLIVHRIQSLLEHQRVLRERAALEESLVVAEQLANVGLLASGISHEMSNPLTCVLGNLELAQLVARRFVAPRPAAVVAESRPDSAVSLNEAISEALCGAEKLSSVLADLRRLATHAESDPVTAVDVRLVLDAMAKFISRELSQRARLVREFQPVPLVEGNQGRLGQVFLNLLVNAAQAIPPGSPEEHEVRVATRVEEGWVIVEVSDSAESTAPDARAALFRPFFTSRGDARPGSLGLSICRRIIQDHRGTLDLACGPGKGSTFRVTLPAGNGADLLRRANREKRP